MNEPPARVRVTGPPRRRTPLARTREVDAETPLGAVYLGSLLREQLWLAVRTLVALGLGLGLVPVLFLLVPGLTDVQVLGLPLAWLVAYPFLVLLGWRYLRRAESNEDAFVELMEAGRAPGPAPERRRRR